MKNCGKGEKYKNKFTQKIKLILKKRVNILRVKKGKLMARKVKILTSITRNWKQRMMQIWTPNKLRIWTGTSLNNEEKIDRLTGRLTKEEKDQ